jgi:hypothetical protein
MTKLKLVYDFRKDAKIGDLVRIVDRGFDLSKTMEIVGFFQGIDSNKLCAISQYNPPSQLEGEGMYHASLHNVWEYEILRRAKQGGKQ